MLLEKTLHCRIFCIRNRTQTNYLDSLHTQVQKQINILTIKWIFELVFPRLRHAYLVSKIIKFQRAGDGAGGVWIAGGSIPAIREIGVHALTEQEATFITRAELVAHAARIIVAIGLTYIGRVDIRPELAVEVAVQPLAYARHLGAVIATFFRGAIPWT